MHRYKGFIMLELDINEVPYSKLIPPNKLSNDEYHKLDGISASGLKQAFKDPKLYFNKHLLKRVPSPALELGKALHEALLEPKSFYVSKYSLTQSNVDKLEIMLNNAKVMFSYITENTLNEYSLLVKDNGFIRKVRADAYDKEQGIIYDIKTTRHNSPSLFIKDAYEFGYHLQSAYYIDTLKLAGYKANAFAFLVIPSDSPCEPYAVQITDRFIEDGRASYTEVLQNILDRKESESVYFRQMDLPRWRLEQLGEIA